MSDPVKERTLERRRCLVVDDSAVVRRVAGRMLRDMNFQVDEAVDGRCALDKCSAAMSETILLDWNMPVMNGIEFLRALRQLERGDYLRVVYCTTQGDVDHIREAFDAGADEYIIKPFDATTLQAKMFVADS